MHKPLTATYHKLNWGKLLEKLIQLYQKGTARLNSVMCCSLIQIMEREREKHIQRLSRNRSPLHSHHRIFISGESQYVYLKMFSLIQRNSLQHSVCLDSLCLSIGDLLKTGWLVNSDTISTLYVRFAVRWLAVCRDRFNSWHTYVVRRDVKFKGRNFARGVMSEKYLIWIFLFFFSHKYHNFDTVCFLSLILLFWLWYYAFFF